MNNLDIEFVISNDIAEQMSRAIKEEIDFDIICSVLVSQGWTKVKIDYSDVDEDVIKAWAASNSRGNFKALGIQYVFEHSEDATAFALKWQ